MSDVLSPYQWQNVIARIRTIWGHDPKWKKAELNYRHNTLLRTVPKEALMSAITQFEREGREWAPSIPQLIAATGYGSEYRESARPAQEMCTHPTVSQLGDVEICAACLCEWAAGTRPVTVGEYPYKHSREKWQ